MTEKDEENKDGSYRRITHFEDGEGTFSEDKLPQHILDAVHKVLPFSSSQNEIYRCPNWSKMLLY